MKKRLSVILAMVLSTLSISATLSANAFDLEGYRNFAYHSYDSYTLETDTFSYSSSALILKDMEADFMVTGVFRYTDGKIAGYTVFPVGDWGENTRGWLERIKDIDGRELEIGDLIGSTEGSEWCSTAIAPATYYAYNDSDSGHFCTPTYLGNGVDLLGEEFKNVIRHELVTGYDLVTKWDEVPCADVSNIDIVNGDVTADEAVGIVDVVAANQYLLGVYQPSDYGILAADVNHNGTVEDADAMKILKSLVKLETLEIR